MSVTGPLPPLSEELLRFMVPPLELNPVKGGDFREIGETYAGYCRTLCGLAPGTIASSTWAAGPGRWQ